MHFTAVRCDQGTQSSGVPDMFSSVNVSAQDWNAPLGISEILFLLISNSRRHGRALLIIGSGQDRSPDFLRISLRSCTAPCRFSPANWDSYIHKTSIDNCYYSSNCMKQIERINNHNKSSVRAMTYALSTILAD